METIGVSLSLDRLERDRRRQIDVEQGQLARGAAVSLVGGQAAR